MDRLVLEVEDRRLDRAARGTRRGGGRRTGPARPRRRRRPPARARAGPARPHICRSEATVPGNVTHDRGVERADVDPELERVGRDDGEQLAVRRAAPRARGAAGACSRRGRARRGRRARGRRRLASSSSLVSRRRARPLARLDEADRPRALAHELGDASRPPRPARCAASAAPRRPPAGSTSRSAAARRASRRGRRASTSSRPVSRSASSTGLAIVALASRKRGSVP